MSSCLTEKLPESWKHYKNTLKHKRKSMPVGEVIIRIRVEDQNWVKEWHEVAKELLSKAIHVEHPNKPKIDSSKDQNKRKKYETS